MSPAWVYGLGRGELARPEVLAHGDTLRRVDSLEIERGVGHARIVGQRRVLSRALIGAAADTMRGRAHVTNRRVLIVEDSAAARAVLSRALEGLGAVERDEAVDGLDALRKLRRTEYDCVLIDLNMPRIDGLKLIERIRATKHKRPPRIVVVSGRMEQDRERALALGADAFVTKPIKLPELAALVKRLLEEG